MQKNRNASLFWLLISFSLMYGCGQGASPNTQPDFDVLKYRRECLPVSEVTINDSVPFIMSKAEFLAVFGRADSAIAAPPWLYSQLAANAPKDNNCRYLCKGQSIFVEKGAHVYPILLDLRSTPVSLHADPITLKLNTLDTEIKHWFPMSARLLKNGDGNGFGGYIMIDGTGNNLGDDLWFLHFRGGGLQKIICYTHP